MTREVLAERETTVFDWCRANRLPAAFVLAGGYKDAGKQFARGDFDVKEVTDHHRPVADEGGECIGLLVLDAPVRLTGPVGRLLNPFLRI